MTMIFSRSTSIPSLEMKWPKKAIYVVQTCTSSHSSTVSVAAAVWTLPIGVSGDLVLSCYTPICGQRKTRTYLHEQFSKMSYIKLWKLVGAFFKLKGMTRNSCMFRRLSFARNLAASVFNCTPILSPVRWKYTTHEAYRSGHPPLELETYQRW